MKKNKMMRVASALLIAVLLTTSAISGTFAKYVTTNYGSDTARVARWGVEIAVADDLGLFAATYTKDSTDANIPNTITHTVTSANGTDQIVAPGTNGSMTFNISGTPEVATKVTFAFTDTSYIHLDAGTYTLSAGKYAAADTSVTTTAVYEPIYFYFYEGTTAPTNPTKYTMSGLKAAVEAVTAYYGPNTQLDKTYTLAWAWDFEGTDANANFLDTYLGDETTLQNETFTVTVTVEQVD